MDWEQSAESSLPSWQQHPSDAQRRQSFERQRTPSPSQPVDARDETLVLPQRALPRGNARDERTFAHDRSHPSAYPPAFGVDRRSDDADDLDATVVLPRFGRTVATESRQQPFLSAGQHDVKQRKRRPSRTHIAIAATLLACVLLLLATGSVDAYQRYSHDRALASDGMQRLHAIQKMLPAGDVMSAAFNPTLLAKARVELVAGESDFASLRSDLGAPQGTIWIGAHLPVSGSAVSSAASLAAGADEACLAGLDLVGDAQTLSAVLKGGFFASSATAKPPTPAAPQLNAATLAQLKKSYEDAVTHLNSAIAYLSQADLSVLPSSLVSAKQLQQIRSLMANWPATQQTLAQIDAWLTEAPTILGISSPEHLLLVLMDHSEIRPTGGFQGNFAYMTVQNGKVLPFSLTDTYQLDDPYVAQHGPLPVPAAYASWWTHSPKFSLHDSNLSANFPTSAQASLQMYHTESGKSAQGLIAITPAVIERLLKVVGNVSVPEYGETVTSSNLESLIHKYQLGSAIHYETERKQFTALLAQRLMLKLHNLTSSQLGTIIKYETVSLHDKDIQVYLGDEKAEALLAKDGVAGTITQGPGDGVTIIDTNTSTNKVGPYTLAKYDDAVTLDAQGNATHHLTITYRFHATNLTEIYGPDYFRTYLRIYTPPNAHLIHDDGFNFTIQGPTQINHSDEPGRQMWGGVVVVQDGAPYTLHFVWTTPGAATRDSSGHWRYLMTFQHQAGSNQFLTLTVAAPGMTKPLTAFNSMLNADQVFTVSY